LLARRQTIAGRMVFLTDGRAISYAESVMAYAAVVSLERSSVRRQPEQTAMSWRSLYRAASQSRSRACALTRPEGVSPHHLIGIQPDIALASTIAAIRAGRDELIEKAVSVVEQQ
jgi:hypothetical protein